MSKANWHRHLSSLLPVNAVQALIGFGSLAVYSRLMSPASYGEYVLALTSQMFGQWVLFSWLNMGVARFTPRSQQDGTLPSLLSTAYLLSGLISLVCLAGAAAYYFLVGREQVHGDLITATILSCVIRGMAQLGLEVHRNSLKIPRYSVLEASQAIFGLGLGAWLVSLDEGRPGGAFIGITLANLWVLLADSGWLLRVVRFSSFARPVAAMLWRYGAPMTLSLILGLGIANLDRYLLAAFNGQEAVAIYGAASALAERPLSIVFVWVGAASSSLGFHAMERSAPEQARQTMEAAARSLILLTWPMAAGLAVLADPVTTLMLGQAFHTETAALLPLIVLAGLCKGFAEHYFAQFFLLTGRTSVLSIILTVVLLVSIAANLSLLPILGTPGAPISAMVAYGLAIALQIIFIIHRFRVAWPWGDTLKGALACALMYAVVSRLQLQATPKDLAMGVAAGVGSYGMLALALNLANLRTNLFNRLRRERAHG